MPASAEPDATSRFLVVPEGMTQVISSDGQVQLQGSLSVFVWQARVSLSNGQTFESGVRDTRQPAGSLGTWEREYQLLELRASNATMDLDWNARPVTWAARQTDFDGRMEARFVSASGTMTIGEERELLNESVSITGDAHLSARNESTGRVLNGELLVRDGTLTRLRTDSVPETSPTKLGTQGRPGGPLWSVVSGGVLVVAFLAFGIHRFEPLRPDIIDVEWAILGGHRRRAERWGRRLARREPRSADAVFLYATALLGRGKLGALLEVVEPMASRIPRRERVGIAFLLTVAAKKVGDEGRALRWAREASREPRLFRQLSEDASMRTAIAGFRPYEDSGYV